MADAFGGGKKHYEIWWGDLHHLADVLPESVDLTAIDLFGKENRVLMTDAIHRRKIETGGEVFIP
ncbi:hypothetical protein [Methanogenium sp. MK-MG]|uniref:hypothetical protein n=1 Tax=Methanogenium sp. MK-MG TaxID=2599926 RepID=UPI0013EBDD2D|nr:hypothetical protein [Methanogenium sp. MK-MG]KAF1076410.1 hypothetical protein MKMG_01516 [Methanogenium sp. MK-MG]